MISLFANKNDYKWITTSTPFDYLQIDSHKHDTIVFYYWPFWIVRVKLSDSAYETVITNLDIEEFPPKELTHLYGMRWGIETSFRELKNTVSCEFATFPHKKGGEYYLEDFYQTH